MKILVIGENYKKELALKRRLIELLKDADLDVVLEEAKDNEEILLEDLKVLKEKQDPIEVLTDALKPDEGPFISLEHNATIEFGGATYQILKVADFTEVAVYELTKKIPYGSNQKAASYILNVNKQNGLIAPMHCSILGNVGHRFCYRNPYSALNHLLQDK